ncbi:hypothetical protein EPD60_12675 [Flaviaesturariibacter flavus]|uniref:Uncharacterized protein n=1 Tax=Flaviaesturariibacter flavus TaxID=2502780 RepID=A0A4R1B8S5_9BACT|nr:hypothetical protein EPD60_12675 [Flaviaesturariibacter flavus]
MADSTIAWCAGPFWINGLDTATYATLLQWRRDEHHPFNRFVPEEFPGYISTLPEMQALQRAVGNARPRPLRLSGAGYATSAKAKAAPLRIEISEPVYSTDRRYAFLSAAIILRSADPQWSDQWAVLLAVFYSDGKTWRKASAKGMLIL